MNATFIAPAVCAAVFARLVISKECVELVDNDIARFDLVDPENDEAMIISEIKITDDLYTVHVGSPDGNPEWDTEQSAWFARVTDTNQILSVIDFQTIPAIKGMPFALTPAQLNQLNEVLEHKAAQYFGRHTEYKGL